jgi:Tfp pilus assembly protein PilP
MSQKMLTKFSILFSALILFAEVCFFPTLGQSEILHDNFDGLKQTISYKTKIQNPARSKRIERFQFADQKAAQAHINLEIAAPETTVKKESLKKIFGDKDKSQVLSEAIPQSGDSCSSMLYGDKELISLDFQNANIRSLFRIISEFSGFNLIVSSEVSGSVDVRLFDIPWNEALEIILANSLLARQCFGKNTIRITSRQVLEEELALKEASVNANNLEASPEYTDSCYPVLYGDKEPVSLDFQNATIRNLFRIISEVSGFNLILSTEVSGSVSIRMLDVPWNEALEIILANNGLGRECFVDGVVRIAKIETLNLAPKTIEAKKKSKPRLMGKELKDMPPVAMPIYHKIQNEFPELLKKMNYFESLFNNQEKLKEMSDEEYNEAVEKYKSILNGAGEIEISKTPLQEDYQLIKLKGIVSIKKERVALFETLEQTGFSARKGDLIGPFFGQIDDIQPEKVIVVEKSRNYLGVPLTRQHSIGLGKDLPQAQ